MINVISDTEIKQILSYLESKQDEKKLLVITLALFSGLRATEVATLRWRDVMQGFLAKRFFVPSQSKKNNKMPAFMNTYSASILENAVQRARRRKIKKNINGKKINVISSYVLGKKYSRANIWKMWNSVQKRVYGYSAYRFHDLRHTAITNFYRRTRDIALTQQFARHKNISCTMRYVHVVNREKIVEVVDDMVVSVA